MLPTKCRECARSKVSHPHQMCHFCKELGFEESVLCDLNRCIQEEANFMCQAFQPVLKLVSASENKSAEQHHASLISQKKESYLRLFDSDKIKYERALALQRLRRDPDEVYVLLKYHLAWNVKQRMPVFNPISNFINFVHDTFLVCSERIEGFVDLLFLAPDHIHLYAESDGELSVEKIVHTIKRFSNHAILDEFPSAGDKLGGDNEIWDEAYFAETIG
jgi:REP element-mobilizing transposase RayT